MNATSCFHFGDFACLVFVVEMVYASLRCALRITPAVIYFISSHLLISSYPSISCDLSSHRVVKRTFLQRPVRRTVGDSYRTFFSPSFPASLRLTSLRFTLLRSLYFTSLHFTSLHFSWCGGVEWSGAARGRVRPTARECGGPVLGYRSGSYCGCAMLLGKLVSFGVRGRGARGERRERIVRCEDAGCW